MIEIPKLGYRLTHTNNVTKVSVTNNPDGEEDGFCYYAHEVPDSSLTSDTTDKSFLVKNDYIYIGAYIGTISDTKIYSSSDKTSSTSSILNIRNRDANFGSLTYYQYLLLQCLYLIKYKDRNSRNYFSKLSNSISSNKTTGLTNKLGFNGSDENIGNKFIGIEDLFDKPTFLSGVLFITSSITDAYGAYRSIYTPNYTKRYLISTNGYPLTKTGYMSIAIGTNESGFLPLLGSSVTGSSSTYYCAYMNIGVSNSSSAYSCVTKCDGIFDLTATLSNSNIRLVYYPKITNSQTTE